MITTYYNIEDLRTDSSQTPIRIAIVSDLHDRSPFAALRILKKEQPDLILIPGDLMERHEPGETTSEGVCSEWLESQIAELQGEKQISLLRTIIKLLDGSYVKPGGDGKPKIAPENRSGNRRYNRKNGYYFLKKASEIAPIVYSSGNHEWYHTPKDIHCFKKLNILFLDNCYQEIDIKGRHLLVGGFPPMFELKALKRFSEADPGPNGKKILLMHQPDYYDKFVKEIDTFDLIVSGHAHGGQFRIFGHGIFAPNQGFFPKYHHGIYPANGTFVVSAGCSNTNDIPRIGNPTEVVIIEG